MILTYNQMALIQPFSPSPLDQIEGLGLERCYIQCMKTTIVSGSDKGFLA